jgi:tetratricopeptide (TPR) repeat protein
MGDLAVTLEKEGRYSEAEKLERQTVEAMRRVLGPEHPYLLQTTDELAHTLNKEGRLDEAEKLARETLAIQRRVVGPEHPDAASTAYDLGCILAQSGRIDEAFSLLREAIDHGLDPATDHDMASTPDLKALHKDPRFTALVAYAQQRAAAEKLN